MRKGILLIIILLIVLIAGVVYIWQTLRPDNNVPASRYPDIVMAVSNGLEEHDIINDRNALIIDKAIYYDDWILAQVTNKDEPVDGEARSMAYILRDNAGVLQLIAFSGDSFSEDSFPENTPNDIIKKVNSSW